MSYNKEQRRGLYNKPHKRHKPRQPTRKARQDQTVIDNNGLTPYLNRFIEWGEIKGDAKATLVTRRRVMNRFILWCDERDLQEPQSITRDILEHYQKHLYHYRKKDGEPLTHGTQLGLLMPVRLFFKWLAKTRQILYNPASELDLPRQQRRLPQALLSIEEVKTILNTADTTTPFGVRDRAMLETFYNTGIRRMELANLQIYNIDLSRQTLHVRKGKGNKDRIVPIGEGALNWIQQYLDEVRPILIKEHAEQTLFLTDYGEPWIRNRLTDMVKKYLYHAGIDKPGACHLFRHAMATHMLDNGADIRFIQAMLGHSLLSTTQIYTQVSVESLRKVHNETHPLNRQSNRQKNNPTTPTPEGL
jgi:integrase/recombinase XerD